MHQVYFVMLPEEEADSVEEAINEAVDFLDSNGFSGDGGLYSSPKSDWYEVGGRWSGLFTTLQPMYTDFEQQVKALLKSKYPTLEGISGIYYGDKEREALKMQAAKEVEALWATMPKELSQFPCPDTRHTEMASPSVQSDSAVLMTAELWENLKNYAKGDDVEVVNTAAGEEYTLSTLEDYYNKDEIKKHWFVCIDYHN